MSLERTDSSASRPAAPGLAPPPRCAPPRPDPPVVCPGFGFIGSVYIGFRLFVLPKRRSGQLFSIPWRPWRARGTVVFWASRLVGVPPCRDSPRPAARAMRRPSPTRPCFVRVICSTCYRENQASVYWSAARNEERSQSRW